MLIAEHGFIEAGWRWKYELYASRLILIGLRGAERQEFELELRHASPVPDRWVEEYNYRTPRWLLATALPIIILTIFPCCSVMSAADWARDPIVPPMWVPNILTVTLIAFIVEVLGVCAIPRIFGIKHFRRLVRYKRPSDGGELIRFSSELNPTGDAFEEFVSHVTSAIAAERLGPEPPPSHAFKAL